MQCKSVSAPADRIEIRTNPGIYSYTRRTGEDERDFGRGKEIEQSRDGSKYDNCPDRAARQIDRQAGRQAGRQTDK